jgi:hypothetical protein
MSSYEQRRAAFARGMGEGAAVIPAARHRVRNADTEYEYRQNSDFYYLTGFDEPEAVLVLAPTQEKERVVLFLRPRDRAQEIWTGGSASRRPSSGSASMRRTRSPNWPNGCRSCWSVRPRSPTTSGTTKSSTGS